MSAAVAGRRIQMPIEDFEQACLVSIAELQEHLNHDSALLGLLCESVRLARQWNDREQRDSDRLVHWQWIPRAPQQPQLDINEN